MMEKYGNFTPLYCANCGSPVRLSIRPSLGVTRGVSCFTVCSVPGHTWKISGNHFLPFNISSVSSAMSIAVCDSTFGSSVTNRVLSSM
jgi:hypothetical protein